MDNDLRRGLVGLVSGLLLWIVVAPAALAHAAYESSDPPNGGTVSSPPSRVTAEFTEPVVDDSRLEVYDPCGARVDNRDSLVAADRITVSMSADKQGTYRVHFAVVSSVDGHATSGNFGFSSSGGSPCPGEAPAEEVPAEEDPGGGGESGNGGGGGGDESAAEATGDSSSSNQPNSPGNLTKDGPSAPDKRSGEPDGREGEGRGRRAASGSGPNRDVGDFAAGAANVSDGIPVRGLVVALLVAAVIGGAGALVFSGTIGPKV